ncbi:hypothetical protein FWH09_02165, partial [Candidatus Saccharibacteria bacterium]|nr:hypothetical protein [Candidatus Saccharibacteria bacterium]
MKNAKDAWKNLRLVAIESIITAGIMSMPIMTPFFISIGMSQEEIAFSQMIFTVVVIVLGIPAGWLADRFSRKWANIIGNFGCAISLLLFSQVQSFGGAVLCESIFGLSIAFSQGVDASLLKHFSGKIDKGGKLFKTMSAKVAAG